MPSLKHPGPGQEPEPQAEPKRRITNVKDDMILQILDAEIRKRNKENYDLTIKRQRDLDFADKNDRIKARSYIISEGGQKKLLSDQVKEDIRANKDIKARAFDDWRAAMSTLIGSYMTFTKYLGNKMETVYAGIKQAFKQYVVYKMTDSKKKKLMDKEEIILPRLAHSVRLTDNNTQLKANILPVSGGEKLIDPATKAIGDAIEKRFSDGVALWLENEHGYKKRKDGKYIKDGVELDNEELEHLKSDKHHGINAFLTAQFGLHFHDHTPRPR